MPTTDEVETAIADLKRAQNALEILRGKKSDLQAEIDAVNAQMATLRASVAANEMAARAAAVKFGQGA